MSAEFHSCVEVLRRFPVRVRLFLLLSCGRSGGRVRFLEWRSKLWLRHRCGLRGRCHAGDFLLRNFLANFALWGKQPPIGDGKTFLLLFSHRLSLQCLQVIAFEYVGKWQSRDGEPSAARLKLLARGREFAADITQRHGTLAAAKGQGSNTRNLANIAAIGLDLRAHSRQRTFYFKPDKLAMHVAPGANSFYDLLPDVAPLAEMERPLLLGLLGQITLTDVLPVTRNPGCDAQQL